MQVHALERSASPVALLKFLRWKNSQLPVNRPPREILVIIATYATADHFTGYVTLIHLTHVCTQWRRIITTCPTLWTDIRFGEEGMPVSLANLFFERAEGCALKLDVHLQSTPHRHGLSQRASVIPTLSLAHQVKSLVVNKGTWDQVKKLIGGWTYALSSLHELEVHLNESSLSSDTTIFAGELLKELLLVGCAIPGLAYIVAPKLTNLKLWEYSLAACSVKRLFDFFDASPTLEYVTIDVNSSNVYDFPPQDRKVVLPRLCYLYLCIEDPPRVASYLVCPSKIDTHFVGVLPDNLTTELFPPNLYQLLGQHSVEVIDRVFMHISDDGWEGYKLCSLQFFTFSGTMFRVARQMKTFLGPFLNRVWTFSVLFNQAVTTLLSLPLDQVVMLSIDTQYCTSHEPDPDDIKTRLAEVLGRCSRLREVELKHYPPSCFPDFSRDGMPPIQTLVINCLDDVLSEESVESVTEVARTRHSRGTPLKRLEIVTFGNQPRIEGLESLVQEVEYRGPEF